MMASAITMATNVAANYVLIFGALGAPELGIRGAAYGTVIGSLAGVLSLLCFFFSEKNKADYQVTSAFKFHWRIMGRLLRFGYPNGIELFFNLLAFNSMVLLFHSRGPVIATASTIMFNWDMVSFVPLLGVEIGVISLVGRYVGAKQPSIAEQATISGLKLGLVYSAIVFVLFVCFPECLVSVFSPRNPSLIFDQAVPTAVNMIRLASLYVMFEAVVITYTGALRGAGDTFWAMCISTSSHWTLVALLFLLLHVLDTSAETAWLWMVIAFLPLSCLVYLRYRTGHWREIQVIDTTPEAKEIACEAFHEASPS
jgi:MATE family multidrug resistance protein